MKTFTAKQRADIYLRAANVVATIPINGCCWAIRHTTNPKAKTCNSLEILGDFPEFGLFEPDEHPAFWWDSDNEKEDRQCRFLALLFAHQMALNP